MVMAMFHTPRPSLPDYDEVKAAGSMDVELIAGKEGRQE
jgi:hypothetical protein